MASLVPRWEFHVIGTAEDLGDIDQLTVCASTPGGSTLLAGELSQEDLVVVLGELAHRGVELVDVVRLGRAGAGG